MCTIAGKTDDMENDEPTKDCFSIFEGKKVSFIRSVESTVPG